MFQETFPVSGWPRAVPARLCLLPWCCSRPVLGPRGAVLAARRPPGTRRLRGVGVGGLGGGSRPAGGTLPVMGEPCGRCSALAQEREESCGGMAMEGPFGGNVRGMARGDTDGQPRSCASAAAHSACSLAVLQKRVRESPARGAPLVNLLHKFIFKIISL